jgi:hypothetical protein
MKEFKKVLEKEDILFEVMMENDINWLFIVNQYY